MADVSPNHHALAERFGIFDRFFTNAEASQQGHIWSNGAYVTDYGEKTVHSLYADKRPDRDEGDVDDAQDGPDHVDSHRSLFLSISAWSKSGVHHRFTNTSDIVGAIGRILGLRPLSQFDLRARPIEFAATPDSSPYQALTRAVSLDEKNPDVGKAAELSSTIDLTSEDKVDDALFNRILGECQAAENRARTH